jgi:hypothetical protein
MDLGNDFDVIHLRDQTKKKKDRKGKKLNNFNCV